VSVLFTDHSFDNSSVYISIHTGLSLSVWLYARLSLHAFPANCP